MFPSAHPTLNQLWAHLLLEELRRRGVRHCCLAPGSRSTPLLLAALRLPQLQLHQHLDERGLGFLALGLAKGSGETVALITTSGTAVANLYPAVIEASLSGAKLVLLSADRPPRLWQCGANQAIRQPGIFAHYPRAVLNLDPPNTALPAAQLLSELGRGLDAIQQPAGGVLHINCPYDEPLYPDGRVQDFAGYLAPVADWCTAAAPWSPAVLAETDRAPEAERVAAAALALPGDSQWRSFAAAPGLIVVGALAAGEVAAEAIKALAQRLGWPLLADIQSPLKFDPDCLGLADLLLSQADTAAALGGGRHLLQFGGRLVSKRLQQWIDGQPWDDFWVVHPGDYPLAPGRNQHAFFAAPVAEWCRALPPPAPQASPASAPLLLTRNRALAAQLAQRFGADGGHGAALSELNTAYQLLAAAPAASTLVAGNSLAIRMLDLVGGNLASAGPPRLLANRGASGIEGLVATAAGAVLAGAGPVTLLLGDTSLLYDLNGLALLRELPAPLVIVVLNNDGGGIFELLPVPDAALRRDHYQRPHGLQFDAACTLFGLDYARPDSPAALVSAYQQALAAPRSTLIEVVCDARATAAEIRALTQDLKTG